MEKRGVVKRSKTTKNRESESEEEKPECVREDEPEFESSDNDE